VEYSNIVHGGMGKNIISNEKGVIKIGLRRNCRPLSGYELSARSCFSRDMDMTLEWDEYVLARGKFASYSLFLKLFL
jgi:hypothetical protein